MPRHELGPSSRRGFIILLTGIIAVPRLIGVLFTTLADANPYAQADVNQFSRAASASAKEFQSGVFPHIDTSSIIELWGLFLSPLWLLPGPSWVYARTACALLGVIAIYNVFIIGCRLHSPTAGFIAVLPLALYPSSVLVHSTILRESAVLFGLTGAVRVWLRYRVTASLRLIPLAVGFLALATVLRSDNLPIYALVIATILFAEHRSLIPRGSYVAGVIVGLISLPVWIQYVASGFDTLARIRLRRAFGRAVYLPDIAADSITTAVAFSYIGAGYFLFSPFPWMVTQLQDLVVAIEGTVNLLTVPFAVLGVRDSLQQPTITPTAALLVGLSIGAVLYGFGTANVGTAVRHRQMFVWVLFVFGAVGLCRRVNFRV